LIGIAFEVVAQSIGMALPKAISQAFEYSLGAILYFAPLYAVLAIVALALLRGQSVRAHVFAALASPIVFALMVPVYLFLTGADRSTLVANSFEFARLTLLMGYAYVAVALAGQTVLYWKRRSPGPT
jgi:hypothetical protein